MNNNKGFITFTVIFEAMSLNRDEGLGNIQSLHLLTRGDGSVYSYMSRQALTYSIRKFLIESGDWKQTGVNDTKNVIQYEGTIDEFQEIDLFGYLKTKPGTDGKSGSADVRPSAVTFTNAVSLEPYNGDMAFYANPEMARRLKEKNVKVSDTSEISNLETTTSLEESDPQENDTDQESDTDDKKSKKDKFAPNPYNRQEHRSFYKYSVVIDLNRVSKEDSQENQDNGKAKERLQQLMDAVGSLHHQVAGYREALYPLFISAAHIKYGSPIFHNYVELSDKDKNRINGFLFCNGIRHADSVLKNEADKSVWAVLEGSGDLHLGISGDERLIENNLLPLDVIGKVKEWIDRIYKVKESDNK